MERSARDGVSREAGNRDVVPVAEQGPSPAFLLTTVLDRTPSSVFLLTDVVYRTPFAPDTALAISHTENWRGIPGAWSTTGCCVGVMQVNVRYWYGRFHRECGGSDLFDIHTNACYGVLIWQHHLRECRGDGACALRAYVGQRNNPTIGDFYLREIQRYLVEP